MSQNGFNPAATELPPSPESLRVAIVSESSFEHMSGVTTSVFRIMDHLRAEGHDAVAVCPGPAPEEYAGFPVETVFPIRHDGFNIGWATAAGKVGRLFSEFRPDIVHVASPASTLGGAAINAATRRGIPNVAVYQTDLPGFVRHSGKGFLSGFFEKRLGYLHNRANLTLAPTKESRDTLVGYGAPAERIRLWGRGVDTDLFTPAWQENQEVEDLRKELSPDGKPIVGYVSRLAPEKRIDRLAALEDMDAQLVVVGDGDIRKDLEPLLPHAKFLGELRGEELARAYASFDIFVHTGTEETFGQTLQEAMAAGLPVIAPAVGGPLAIVHEGETGFLYPAGEDYADGLRSTVNLLVENPELRQQMGRRGREIVENRTWPVICRQLIDHYYSLIRQPEKLSVPDQDLAAAR